MPRPEAPPSRAEAFLVTQGEIPVEAISPKASTIQMQTPVLSGYFAGKPQSGLMNGKRWRASPRWFSFHFRLCSLRKFHLNTEHPSTESLLSRRQASSQHALRASLQSLPGTVTIHFCVESSPSSEHPCFTPADHSQQRHLV